MEALSNYSNKEFEFTRADFDYLRNVVVEMTGIVSGDEKYTMYYARLAKRLRILGLEDFKTYREYLKLNPESESIELVNSLTTNLTSFFRESHHFEYLAGRFIPYHKKLGKRRLRIWSAGCSTGEEAYSIAMTLQREIQDIDGWDIRIVASDIDSEVLAIAKTGVYESNRIENLDASLQSRYFHPSTAKHDGIFVVRDELKQLVQFQQLNLLHAWPFRESFDLIFCRNVVIYFSVETKVELVNRFADQLCPRGVLLMGHSESLYKTSDRFESLGNTVYQLIERKPPPTDTGSHSQTQHNMPGAQSSGMTLPTQNRVNDNCTSTASEAMVIAIGASTGGTEAIQGVLSRLSANSPGVVICQHIPGSFSSAFADRLNQNSALKVCQAVDGQPIRPGHAYLAPGNRHLKVARINGVFACQLDNGPSVNRHKPSVDVLFSSTAQAVGANAIGVLLTGMGDDGADALGTLRRAGAVTIAQDEASSVVWGMPGMAVRRGHADHVLELSEIAPKILGLVSKHRQND